MQDAAGQKVEEKSKGAWPARRSCWGVVLEIVGAEAEGAAGRCKGVKGRDEEKKFGKGAKESR